MIRLFSRLTAVLLWAALSAGAADYPPGSLAEHLATNTAARTAGVTDVYRSTLELTGWDYKADYSGTNLVWLTRSVWSTNCWLKGVQGLSATPIGMVTNNLGGQGLMTMISPRHYLCATHMHPEGHRAAFLGTNNVIYWRTTVQRIDLPGSPAKAIGSDISVGILNEDLPPSVGFLPVLPANFPDYLPTRPGSVVQGIGLNQDLRIFSQPMTFAFKTFVAWNSAITVPAGMSKDWNVTIRGGDSSDPDLLLIHNQLVLVSHHFYAGGGPNYALAFAAINAAMHELSTNNNVSTDYQLTPVSLAEFRKLDGGF